MTILTIEDKIDINESNKSATVFNLEENIQKDMHSMSDQRIDFQTKSGKKIMFVLYPLYPSMIKDKC